VAFTWRKRPLVPPFLGYFSKNSPETEGRPFKGTSGRLRQSLLRKR